MDWRGRPSTLKRRISGSHGVPARDGCTQGWHHAGAGVQGHRRSSQAPLSTLEL